MRVKKYLALTLAAVLATTMLTACPWEKEEDKTDDASSVPVTSTDTSQDDDDDHDSGDDDSQPTKPSLTVGSETVTVGGGESEPISVTENGTTTGTYTVKLEQSSDTLTMTIETQPAEKYVTNSVNATVGNASASWTRDTATRALTLSMRADTQLSLTTSDNGKTFTLTGIPADATNCNIMVEFKDPGYTIENDTYMVYNADGLLAWAQSKDALTTNCTLTANIDLTGENWTPIGSFSTPYTGTFDGAGYTISGLQVSGGDCVGLFGYVNGGMVKNLNLEITSVSGNSFVGGVVGRNDGTITGCMVSGSVSGSDYVGGVVGDNWYTVKGCCFAGDSVSGTGDSAFVGGVVGCNYGTVEGCCFAGDSVTASGTGAAAGGVVGYNYGGTITNCYWQQGTGGPSQGVGQGSGAEQVAQIADNVTMQDAIAVMNNCIKDTGYQYKLDNGKPVLVASNSNTPEVSGLTQRVLDVARAVGL